MPPPSTARDRKTNWRVQMQNKSTHSEIIKSTKTHRRLIVMLDRHGDHIDTDDARDEEVQIVVGTQCVNVKPGRRVVCIVGPLLGLCWSVTQTDRTAGQWRKNVLKQAKDTGCEGTAAAERTRINVTSLWCFLFKAERPLVRQPYLRGCRACCFGDVPL